LFLCQKLLPIFFETGFAVHFSFGGCNRSKHATIHGDFAWKPLLFGWQVVPTSESARGKFTGHVSSQILLSGSIAFNMATFVFLKQQ
jgi:hypothetical protein